MTLARLRVGLLVTFVGLVALSIVLNAGVSGKNHTESLEIAYAGIFCSVVGIAMATVMRFPPYSEVPFAKYANVFLVAVLVVSVLEVLIIVALIA